VSTGKRPPRKPAAPAALPVPRVRAIRADAIAEPAEFAPPQARPRRNRKPKFVF
jgi:hypothetical protein